MRYRLLFLFSVFGLNLREGYAIISIDNEAWRFLICFSSISDMHNTWIERKEFEKLTSSQKSAIKSISTKVMKKNIGTQDNPELVDVEFVKIELYDKLKAIECLNKMLGYNEPDKVEVGLTNRMTDDKAKEIMAKLGL